MEMFREVPRANRIMIVPHAVGQLLSGVSLVGEIDLIIIP
jgi:hypothetical protein